MNLLRFKRRLPADHALAGKGLELNITADTLLGFGNAVNDDGTELVDGATIITTIGQFEVEESVRSVRSMYKKATTPGEAPSAAEEV